jgi:hypothetical protein
MKQKIVHKVPYEELRAKQYPSIADQLDMLWHGMNKGLMEKVEPFYSEIKAVKDKFPKID